MYTYILLPVCCVVKNINVDNSRTLIFSRTNVLITQTITSLTLLVIVDFILINEGRVRLTYYEVKKGEIATFQLQKEGLCRYSIVTSWEKYWGHIGLRRLDAVIQRATAKNREDRYASAGTLTQELKFVLTLGGLLVGIPQVFSHQQEQLQGAQGPIRFKEDVLRVKRSRFRI